MKNYWLDKFRIGKTVKYIGNDVELFNKIGKIIKEYDEDIFGVEFEFASFGFAKVSSFIIERHELEIV